MRFNIQEGSNGQVSIGVPSKPSFFTFVPVVHKLPFQSIISEEETSAALTGTPNKNVAVSHEKTTGETMSDGEIFKAEKVFIKDSLEGGAGNIIQPLTELQTHKIKLSYKSLAAIPTNTLLLDQQAIDEQVEREDSPCDTLDRDVEDTHAEMCSPAQLRQQSEELYAVIDEILANSIPATSRSSTPNAGVQQNNSTLPKSLGRETKYASLSSLYPSASMERKLMDPRKTKPGVIRPMTAIPRLTVEDEEEFYPNPFKQSVVKQTLTANKKEKVANMSPEEAGKDFFTSSKGKTMREERKPGRRSPFSLCDLQITEPEDLIGRPVKDAAASFSPSEGRMEAFETHI
ncbi:muscular LMNA-interacting protein isoform X3 [Seriola dumerili]|uniref:muscular LMNA-interacting protein isoform X3 n=1 Tax=Seriola dumerili TaxID=41447 RepID=UPI000BBE08D0|nr:muscular LMNA-interacting protein isoform X3 [Seriola dumerili]